MYVVYETGDQLLESYKLYLEVFTLMRIWLQNVPYFSIDNAHLMYNAHPKLFTLYFYLSFVITFDLPLIPF